MPKGIFSTSEYEGDEEEELDIAVKALEDYLPDSYYEEIKASKEVAKVSIIGKGLLNHYGMAARMFNAL